jgi:predicted nucleotidyltransferase
MRTDPNVAMVARVGRRFGDLLPRIVFMGGSAAGLLVTDPAAASIRATKDVDVIVEIAGRAQYQELEAELRRLGFQPDRGEGAPICRWVVEGNLVDVMPTDKEILGFSNRWYPDAIRTAVPFELPGGVTISLVTAPYFLATKLEAFIDRGKGDYLGSADLEDILAIMDGRVELVREIKSADLRLQEFIAAQLTRFLADRDFIASLAGHLPPDAGSQARLPRLKEVLRELSSI